MAKRRALLLPRVEAMQLRALRQVLETNPVGKEGRAEAKAEARAVAAVAMEAAAVAAMEVQVILATMVSPKIQLQPQGNPNRKVENLPKIKT